MDYTLVYYCMLSMWLFSASGLLFVLPHMLHYEKQCFFDEKIITEFKNEAVIHYFCDKKEESQETCCLML